MNYYASVYFGTTPLPVYYGMALMAISRVFLDPLTCNGRRRPAPIRAR